MRILFVISSTGIGGEQRVASILTNKFIEMGHSVDILTFRKVDKSFAFNEMIPIMEVNPKRYIPKNINRIIKIRSSIKRGDYNVIIGFAVIPSILCSLAGIGLDCPVVVCERNDPDIYPKKWKLVREVAYKFAQGAVFQTKQASEYFGSRFSFYRTVIQNPLELTKVPLGTSENRRKVIVNTSRLTTAKNHHLLIKAFSKVCRDFPDYKLEIYGDGPLKGSLEDYISCLGLTNRINLYDATPNVLEQIKDSELFILTSNHEGFPNSLAEAMAVGIPSISTDCRIGGPRDMINNGKNGLLVEVDDLSGLERSIRKLLGSEELRRQLSLNSVNIRTQLDANNIVREWISFIGSMCHDKQS